MAAIDKVILATKSPCYKAARKMTPQGIVVHSTAANNPYLKRYVQPDDGTLGVNTNYNSWNEPENEVIPHFCIGLDKYDAVKTVQVLPLDICCWCVGDGKKGSYNYNPAYLQFEICEDNLSDKQYCKATYDKAVELCAYLCKKYGFGVDKIVSHHEANMQGMGSTHIDPDHWWGKFGYTMDDFRKAVKNKINEKPVLETSGYKRGDKTIGSLSLKEQLLEAKELGLHKYGMDENRTVGDGTIRAINALLGSWGYKQNGIAGEKFIKRLAAENKKARKKAK